MYLALVYFPEIEHEGFHAFRQKYEPFAGLLPAHMTFIFPVDESIGWKALEQHISGILGGWSPFQVHFCRLEKTVDHWLFWTLHEGNETVRGLHDELYTGILAPHLREDLPFVPHIGLGLFSREAYDFNEPTAELTLDEERYSKARKEFEDLGLDLWCTIDQLTLLNIDEGFTEITVLKTFKI